MKMEDLTDEELKALENQVDAERVRQVIVLTKHEHKKFQKDAFYKEKSEIPEDAEAKAFLADLTQVSRKHGIAILGCGCCGSPYLKKIPARFLDGYYRVSDDSADNLKFVRAHNLDPSVTTKM